VVEKFGVAAESIPDWLALVGDSADGFPGVPGFGAKSAAVLLARYQHLEDIPTDGADWDVTVRGAAKLAATLAAHRADADLFKVLATLRTDAEVGTVDDWQWTGPTEDFPAWCDRFGWPRLAQEAAELAAARRGA
jgi:5'-3' exonuclease